MSSLRKLFDRIKSPVVMRRLLLVIVGIALGVRVYHWNASTLAGNALPMPFGIGTAVVMSGSMEPTLSVNDLVVIREADSYEVGDIVVYQSEHSLVIHRIVDIQNELVIARGDANNTMDDPIAMRYIKGKLVLAIPFLGGAMRLLKSVPGMLAILALAFVLMELSWRKEKARDEEELDIIKAEIRKLQSELINNEKGE